MFSRDPDSSSPITDNTFSGGYSFDLKPGATNYYGTASTVMDVIGDNNEVSIILSPNSTVDSGLGTSQCLFSKINRYIKRLDCAATYYGTASTLLDRFPDKLVIEFGLEMNSTFDSGASTDQYIFHKTNDNTGSSEDDLIIRLDQSDGKLTIDIRKDGTSSQLKSSTNSWTAGSKYFIRLFLGRWGGLSIHVNGIYETLDTSATSLPNPGTTGDFTVGAKDDGTLILDGLLTDFSIIDAHYQKGEKLSITSVSRSGTTATVTMTHNYPIGASIVLSGSSDSWADGTVTVVTSDPAGGSWTYTCASGSGSASGTIISRRQAGEILIGDYRMTEDSGTTLSDSSGLSNDITLTDAAIWDSTDIISSGLLAYFEAGVGALTFDLYRRGYLNSLSSQQVSFASGTDVFVRCSSGPEGQFLYINEDYNTYGNVDFAFRYSILSGTYDDFCLGARNISASVDQELDAVITNAAVSMAHNSAFIAKAYYERRNAISDPFQFSGTQLSITDIDQSWAGTEDFGVNESFIFYDPTAATGKKYDYIASIIFNATSTFKCAVFYADNDDPSGEWTDAGSSVNPILTDYGRVAALTDENGATLKETVTATTWSTGTAYTTAASVVKPTTPNGYAYWCTTAGTSDGSTEPTWPTTPGDTINDNGIVWECLADDSDPSFYRFYGLLFDGGVNDRKKQNQFSCIDFEGTITNDGVCITLQSGMTILGNPAPIYYDGTYYFFFDYRDSGTGDFWTYLATGSDVFSLSYVGVVYKGYYNDGTCGAVHPILCSDGVWRSQSHQTPSSGIVPTDIILMESSSLTSGWSANSNRTPLIQRQDPVHKDQLGTSWILYDSIGGNTYLMSNQHQYQGAGVFTSRSLFTASNKTPEQAFVPYPTISSAAVFNVMPIVHKHRLNQRSA